MPKTFDKETKRTLFYDWQEAFPHSTIDLSAISDDAVNNVLGDLNEDAEGYKYSFEQVKSAMWKFMDEQIDELLENIEERFMNSDAKSHRVGHRFVSRREELLGTPEIDIKEEQRLEKGDYDYDRTHGN